ncbi:protein of unknown function DUF262 [Clostridium sp. DL-VIII]|uniref:DUF262 domain-containing protein n=1 Tax=Clostridium sp. DL-VIII TaxID=641107 RepID=UPI00023AF2B2|nr:DUF262 domain-containing protein [Clostridium sp. DL-VIII]EHI97683.1 protein of unknown function DUF262 [Clostridium sp. DL-VIII]
MALFDLDCSDIVDVFKNNLRIENTVKSISHTFLNKRFSDTVDFEPYYQRKYVWDDDKATYFIESILLGTEVPPIVLFDNGIKKEVIDGRQRYETIKRFLEDKLVLSEKGLKSLTNLSGKKFIQLPEEISDSFINTKIRILRFSVLNEPSLTERQKDKIKKEIFRRYNSGITALKPHEIERAEFIDDKIAQSFRKLFEENTSFLNENVALFVPHRKQKLQRRDRVNYLLSRIRVLIALPFIPIHSYASAKSKTDSIKTFYYLKFKNAEVEKILCYYKSIVEKVNELKKHMSNIKSPLANNILFYEVSFWAFTLIYKEKQVLFEEIDCLKMASAINEAESNLKLWENINTENKSLESIFAQTGSHYYKSVINRYLLVSNYLYREYGFDFTMYFKNSILYKNIMEIGIESNQFLEFKLSKTDPASSSIYDILTDIKSSKFSIRPEYQRSEVISKQKASYLLESILLGIKIPPIFIYKRDDSVSEVIDGQQRLLSIIGFLGEVYKDEDGEFKSSNIDKFKLSKLRILKELNNLDIDRIEEKDNSLKDKILDFPIDIVEINQANNEKFSPIDLFLRLNTKPYPILPNTFEMWNAYIDMQVVYKIKDISREYANKLFKQSDQRMKNEELITTLAYADYRFLKDKVKSSETINIFIRNKRINARMNKKSNITTLFDNITKNNDTSFLDSVNNVSVFIDKLKELTGDNFEKFNILISHKRANVQSRTNQNFYLLWVALCNIPLDKIKVCKEEVFNKIANQFEIAQNVPDNLNVLDFIRDLENII